MSDINQMEKEAEKSQKKIFNLRFVTVSALVVGGVYIMGVAKGLDAGKRLGRLEGYAKATSDIGKIVKEAKEKVE